MEGKNRTWVKILLFIGLVLVVFLGVYFSTASFVPFLLKLPIGVVSVVICLAICYFMAKEQGLKRGEHEEAPKEEVKKDSLYSTDRKNCPKCGMPYDGATCFYCGYKKED